MVRVWEWQIDRALRAVTFLLGAITEIPHLGGRELTRLGAAVGEGPEGRARWRALARARPFCWGACSSGGRRGHLGPEEGVRPLPAERLAWPLVDLGRNP